MGLFVDEIPSRLRRMGSRFKLVLYLLNLLVSAGVRVITMDTAKHVRIPKLALKELVLGQGQPH